jgi:hypothetical protein
LGLQASHNPVNWGGEDSHQSIASGFDHLTIGAFHGRLQEGVVPLQGSFHRLGKLLPQTRAAFQISK